MKNLKAKLNKQGGFTLIEMLIVVAIIAILVAVSIPLVNSALERARESTDAANERSFKAVLVISYTNGKYELAAKGTSTTSPTTASFGIDTVYAYDAATGTLSKATTTTGTGADVKPKAYGKSTEALGVDKEIRKGCILYGYVDASGRPFMQWVKQTLAKPATSAVKNGNLISTTLIEET